MAKSASAAEADRQTESLFKFDYPQRAEAVSHDVSAADRSKAIKAVHSVGSNGPGGVYAHANMATTQQGASSMTSSLPARNRSTTPGTSPMRSSGGGGTAATSHTPLARSNSSMSSSSSASRNQLVNASYSPYSGGRFPTPSDQPQEAFAGAAVRTSSSGAVGQSQKPPATWQPTGSLPPRSVTPGSAQAHRPVTPASTSYTNPPREWTGQTAPAPSGPPPSAAAASLEERLEKYREAARNGRSGSSLASSQEQNALQRVGSLGNLTATATARPSSISAVGASPTAQRGRYSLTGVSPSMLRYGLTSRPTVAGMSGSQSVAGGTRTAELEARLQRSVQDKAHLEGKLEALSAECGLALKQRSELQQQVAVAQAKLEHQTGTAETATKREQQLREELGDLSEQLHDALQQNKTTQHSESDWSAVQEIQDQCKELQSSLEHLRQSSKEQAAETAELRSRLDSAQAERRQADAECKQAASDAAALGKDLSLANDKSMILKEQLAAAHATTDGIREELANAHAASLGLSVELERQRVGATDTEAELRQLQSQTLQRQGEILHSLEDFEAEAVAREDRLQRELKEKSSTTEALERAYREAARDCAELLRTQTAMKSDVHAAERRAAEGKQLADRALADKHTVAEEVASLRAHREQLDRDLEAAAQAIAGHEEGVGALRTELYVAQQAAGMEQDKRRQLEDDLERLRNQMAQLDSGLKAVQSEADGREAEVEEERRRILSDVDDERQRNAQREAELEDALARATAEQRAQALKMGKLEQEREGIEADVEVLTSKHGQLTDELLEAKAGVADAERLAVAARHAATEAGRRADEERQHAEAQVRTAIAGHAAELERATNARLAAEAEAERARRQLENHQQGVETELRAAVEAASLAHRQLQEQQRALAGRLAEAERQKERAEHEAKRSASHAGRLEQEAGALGRELAGAENSRALAEAEVLRAQREAEQREMELNDQVAALQEELGEALQLQQVAHQEAEGVAQQLAEDLERERGRMEGITSAHTTLKDHAGSLEAELANREYSLGRLSSQTADALAERRAEDQALAGKVQQLTGDLAAAQDEIAELHRQLGSGASQDRVAVTDLKEKLAQATAESRQHGNEASRLRQQLVAEQQRQKETDATVAHASNTLQASQREIEQLRRALLEKSSQESAVGEQLRNMSWQNEKLTAEVGALREQNALAEMRHQREAESLRNTSTPTDSADGRRVTSLSGARQLPLSKAAPRSSSGDSGAGTTETDGPAPPSGSNAVVPPPTRELASLRGQLGRKHKTISGLQTCLSSLRGEMEKLQHQMARQSDAVQASNTTCRALESRLRGIKPGTSSTSLHLLGHSPTTPTRNRSPTTDRAAQLPL